MKKLFFWLLVCFWFAIIESLDINYKEGFIMWAVVSGLLLVVIGYFAVNYYRSKKRFQHFKDFGRHLIYIPDGAEVYNALTMQLDSLGLDYVVTIKAPKFQANSDAVRMVSHWDGKNMTRTYLIFNGCEIVTRNGVVISQGFNGEVFS